MPTVGFEPTISAGERPQTCALDRAATGTGTDLLCEVEIHLHVKKNSVKYLSVFINEVVV